MPRTKRTAFLQEQMGIADVTQTPPEATPAAPSEVSVTLLRETFMEDGKHPVGAVLRVPENIAALLRLRGQAK